MKEDCQYYKVYGKHINHYNNEYKCDFADKLKLKVNDLFFTFR